MVVLHAEVPTPSLQSSLMGPEAYTFDPCEGVAECGEPLTFHDPELSNTTLQSRSLAPTEPCVPSETGGESSQERQFTGVRKNKGGRFSARIKINGTNQYIGTYTTAEEAARAFDERAMMCGRPLETLNFPQDHGGPTKGRAYRKRKQNKLYHDSSNHTNLLLQKLADVDRSNPGILRLTMGTLGVPEIRFHRMAQVVVAAPLFQLSPIDMYHVKHNQDNNKYSGVRKQSNHWEARIRFKDKLYSMGFYCSSEAAALAWDITAVSLRRVSKLNFPEVGLAELEQQLDALKCVIAQQEPLPEATGGVHVSSAAGSSEAGKSCFETDREEEEQEPWLSTGSEHDGTDQADETRAWAGEPFESLDAL